MKITEAQGVVEPADIHGTFELYPTHSEKGELTGEWSWRYKARNGKISAVAGESFTRHHDARRAVTDLMRDLGAAHLIPVIEAKE